jgi:hypothetical protein
LITPRNLIHCTASPRVALISLNALYVGRYLFGDQDAVLVQPKLCGIVRCSVAAWSRGTNKRHYCISYSTGPPTTKMPYCTALSWWVEPEVSSKEPPNIHSTPKSIRTNDQPHHGPVKNRWLRYLQNKETLFAQEKRGQIMWNQCTIEHIPSPRACIKPLDRENSEKRHHEQPKRMSRKPAVSAAWPWP